MTLTLAAPRWRAAVVALVVLTLSGIGASATGQNARGRIDGDRWARRNIELIRQELATLPRAAGGSDAWTALGFSVYHNPLLLRDPYAAQVATLAEAYLPHANVDPDSVRRIVTLFRQPEAERRGMDHDAIAATLNPNRPQPAPKPGPPDPGSIGERIRRLPADLVAGEAALFAEVEATARTPDDWRRLGVGYLELAREATRAGDRGRADRSIDRLLGLLRTHPAALDSTQGNRSAVSLSAVAAFLIETDRRDRWDAFLATLPDTPHADLAISAVGSLALEGEFDTARSVIGRHIRPIRPDVATRLEAATRGEIFLPPSRPKGLGVPALLPEEERLQQVQHYVAYGQATRGEVELAGRMLVALQRDEAHHSAGEGRLAAHEWSRFAVRAAEANHLAAAQLGMDHANAMMTYDVLLTPDDREEKARLVREAVGLGRFDIANAMHQTSSKPGAWTRLNLARVYRQRGEDARAAALLDEGIALATPKQAREGSSLAAIAVELQQMGQPDRAERALLASQSRIHGEDFGFSGTLSIIQAAVAMNRVDLLDRLYDQGDRGDRLLLCIMASWQSMNPEAQP